MPVLTTELSVTTTGQGLNLITDRVQQALSKFGPEMPRAGLLHVFIQHTSASLLIQENADPSARRDLEAFLDRLAPENESWHEHTMEGPDDTTAHMKSALTQTSLSIPIHDGKLGLGTWQGIYLWEHRRSAGPRRLLLTVMG